MNGPLTPAERSLRGQLAAHTSWANTPDRTARTAHARQAFEDRFLAEAGGDAKRAESLRRAYFRSVSAEVREGPPPQVRTGRRW